MDHTQQLRTKLLQLRVAGISDRQRIGELEQALAQLVSASRDASASLGEPDWLVQEINRACEVLGRL